MFCTSFRFSLRRIAHARSARGLVASLALVLIAANLMSVAMPLTHASSNAHVGMALHDRAARTHCAGHAADVGSHVSHGACCAGSACACGQACDAVAGIAMLALTPPPTQMRATVSSQAYVAIETRPLRPPIV